jgi:hypothetical protein
MKTIKKFDCVEMKWKIQMELLKEYEGVSDVDFFRIQMERITNNPLLKRFSRVQKKEDTQSLKQVIM